MNQSKYPCPNPFSQLYLIPRNKLYIRFCPFHSDMLQIEDYENLSYADLNTLFSSSPEINAVRDKFLAGDFAGAGCPDGCEFMAAYRMGKEGYSPSDYQDESGRFVFRKANLSLGPDCNIRCRYCLDTDNFEVDFNSCKAKFADFIVPFVHEGGILLLTGGETMLPKWGFVKKLQQLGQLQNNKGSVEFFTNATLLDEKACEAILDAPVEFVGISMDTYKPELFDYIRRGSKFENVLQNAKRLLDMRNARGMDKPEIRILCAVSKLTADHLEQTVDFYLNQGFDMSLNILFKANFSPDFCERISIDKLSLPEMLDLREQLRRIEEKWGNRVYTASFKGQLQNAIEKKKQVHAAQQVLGGGSYARRKEGVNPAIKEKVGTVKIFISYHKDCKVLSSETMVPIQVGHAISKVDLPMLHDDEGENISDKNAKYCELTAQYWAWKNCDADYYGFMHYRRHFAFRDIPELPDLGGIVQKRDINQDYIDRFGLKDAEIYGCIKDYDVILPTPVDTSNWGAINNEVQFSVLDNLHAEDFKKTCETILELYPDYADAVETFRKGHYAYWYNMFIMRKEIFMDYSAWLFSILAHTEPKIDYTYYSAQEVRTLAFMAERLLSIYMIKLCKDRPDLQVKHLKISFIHHPERCVEIMSASQKNNVPVAVSCNEYYMPMLGVMLNSLLEHGSAENFYDILVLRNRQGEETPGEQRNKKMLQNMVSAYSNAGIRFIDISSYVGKREFFVRGNFTPETYFRLFLPKCLPHFDKVLYLDADMVVHEDVARLYATELGDNYLAAVRDPIISGSNKAKLYNKHDYMQKLGIRNIYDYFQAGVLVLNLKKLRETGLDEQMISYASTHDCDLVDQDVLNLFCQGHVKFIDNKWNVDVNTIAMQVVPYAPAAMWKEYQYNRDHAYIYHFAGADKPWKNPNLDKADIFWAAARKTTWYEVLLEDVMNYQAFFRTNTDPKLYEKLQKLALWPDQIAKLVIPLLKAFAELSSCGLSHALAESIAAECEKDSIQNCHNVVFYGAGNCCRQFLLYLDQLGLDYPNEIWDRAAKPGERLFGVPVVRPDFEAMRGVKDTVVIITIESPSITDAVKRDFKAQDFDNILTNKEVLNYLARRLWVKLSRDCE